VDVFNPTFSEPQDAVIRVDSLTLIKDSNSISDVIEGVTLNLLNASTTTANTVTVSQGDAGSAKTGIETFIDTYNEVMGELYTTFSYDPDNPSDNPLRGDYTVRGIQATLKRIVMDSVPGLTGEYTSLYQIGISVDNRGLLTINDAELSQALANDPFEVMKLFADYATPTDSAVSYVSKSSSTNPGRYSVYIYTPPAQASFESSEVVGVGGISEDETLTFTYTDEATETVPTVSAFTVNLSSGDTITTVASKLNSKFASQEVGLVAANDGGSLKIISTDFGADIKFTVVSDKEEAGQTGVGTSMHTETGVDVAGTINGHAAYGKGTYLTGANGFDEQGLKIAVNTTAAGGLGYVNVSSGIAARLSTQLDSITNPSKGTISYRNDTLKTLIDDIDKQIEVKEERLVDMEERLRRQFVKLESLLSSLQIQSDYLNTQLASLPSLYMAGQK
jgi:flagellar hook-associated protein 2